MTSVCFAMPCGAPVDPRVALSVANLSFVTAARGVEVVDLDYAAFSFAVTNRVVIQGARNQLADAFLQTKAEYCFWMDSDMIFPSDAAIKLLKFAKDYDAKFVSGVYYQRVGKRLPACPSCGHQKTTHMPVVWRQDPIIRDKDGNEIVREYEDEYLHHFIFPSKIPQPFKAHVVGFGCVLTHRSLFEQIEKPWFRFLPLEGGKEASEDFYFCVKAKKAGIDLWVVPSVSCGHIGDAPIITESDCIPDAKYLARIPLETVNEKTPKFALVETKDDTGSAA